MQARSENANKTRHRAVAMACAVVVGAMVGMAYAAVPLYRLFCQSTGFGGTTQTAVKPSTKFSDVEVVVRFDANVAPGLAWSFEPVTKPVTVRLGETATAVFRATSHAAEPTVGTAAYNVVPEQAGIFFNKLQCFCFTEQPLNPGQSAELPVQFFVDSAMAQDQDGRKINEITLSYTFFPSVAAKKGVADQGGDAKGRGKGS
jgi:cytochrome c oxidase assembly protein subunit 11